MDQTEKQMQNQKQLLSQFLESGFHRKLTTQLLLSVSVFSLLLSHSYCLSLLHSLNFTFHNTLAFKLFSHKNFIFLLCNGLLVFLAKHSGLISSSSKHNLSDDDHESLKGYEYVPQSESKTPSMEKEVALETKQEDAGFVEENEEMNKRFDEFIRKMKEELRIEARQQLIMV